MNQLFLLIRIIKLTAKNKLTNLLTDCSVELSRANNQTFVVSVTLASAYILHPKIVNLNPNEQQQSLF